jgi:xylulokinase
MSAICFRQITTENPSYRSRVRSYLHLNGWLGLQLTGQRAFDPANASFTGLYATLGDHQWSSQWCDYFDVDKSWLPKVVLGETTLGALRPSAATELGLPAGLPVKLGTADTSSACLDVSLKVGEILHVVGTTQVLAMIPPRPSPGSRRLVRQLGVRDPNLYLHVTHNPLGGAALEWLRELCFADVQDPARFYGEVFASAMNRPTSVGLQPPFLGGDRLEIDESTAAFHHLTLSVNRLDLLAAVCQAMRQGHAEAMTNLGGEGEASKIYLTGGGAPSIKRLLYGEDARVEIVEEGSLKGVARLFAGA